MSAWTKGMELAPKETDVLVKLEDHDCPVILKHVTYDDGSWSGWIWVDELIQDACDPPNELDLLGAKWTPIPEY